MHGIESCQILFTLVRCQGADVSTFGSLVARDRVYLVCDMVLSVYDEIHILLLSWEITTENSVGDGPPRCHNGLAATIILTLGYRILDGVVCLISLVIWINLTRIG